MKTKEFQTYYSNGKEEEVIRGTLVEMRGNFISLPGGVTLQTAIITLEDGGARKEKLIQVDSPWEY